MRRPVTISFFLLLLLSPLTFWGKPDVEWLNTDYDFGVINEDDGPCTGEFRLVNKGKKPLKIIEVKPSCGCTATEFTQEKISRGDTAVIKVFFDPEDRPGKFSKGINVFLNDDTLPKILRIKGRVKPSQETLALFFPYHAGDLYADNINVDFGEVKQGLKKREIIDLYNNGDQPINPSFNSSSDALMWELEPQVIEPGEYGSLKIFLDSSKFNFSGLRKMTLREVSDKAENIEFQIEATVVPPSQ